MVESLNNLSFANFGKILDKPLIDKIMDKVNKLESWEKYLKEDENVIIMYPDDSAFLERESGMAVLHLSEDESLENIKSFYLDKPLEIKKGTWFYLAPLENGCTVRMALPKNPRMVEKRVEGAIETPKSSAVIRVGEIFTMFYQEREKGFFFRGEQHQPYELVYVDKGRLHSVVGGEDYLLKQGNLMIYEPEQWHMQYTDSEHSACFFNIAFSMESQHYSLLTNRCIEVDNRQAELLSRLLYEQEQNDFLSKDIMVSILQELLLLFLRQANKKDSPVVLKSTISKASEGEIIEKAQRYINQNLDKSIKVEEVAKNINISTSYLSALFRKNLGISTSRYISRTKLSEGKRLMREESYNLTQISQKLGYATLPHFSRCFKQEFGITPSEYTKAIK